MPPRGRIEGRVYLYRRRRRRRSEEAQSCREPNHTHTTRSPSSWPLIVRKSAELHSTVCCYIRPTPTAAAGAGPNLTLTALATGAASTTPSVVHSRGELLTTASSSTTPLLLLSIPRSAVGDDPIEKLCSGLPLLPLYVDDVDTDGPK